MATKNDTLFWKEIKEKQTGRIMCGAMYNAVIDGPMSQDVFFDMVTKDIPRHNFYHPIPIFSAGHWWQLLKGCNRYENIEREYSDDFTKYSKMMLDAHSGRMDKVLNIFPNHYDYLTEWYGGYGNY